MLHVLRKRAHMLHTCCLRARERESAVAAYLRRAGECTDEDGPVEHCCWSRCTGERVWQDWSSSANGALAQSRGCDLRAPLRCPRGVTRPQDNVRAVTRAAEAIGTNMLDRPVVPLGFRRVSCLKPALSSPHTRDGLLPLPHSCGLLVWEAAPAPALPRGRLAPIPKQRKERPALLACCHSSMGIQGSRASSRQRAARDQGAQAENYFGRRSRSTRPCRSTSS